MCVCRLAADPGVEEIVPELQDAGQLFGVPLGTNPSAGRCRDPSSLLESGTRMAAWAGTPGHGQWVGRERTGRIWT
jgi:hypothetical protein